MFKHIETINDIKPFVFEKKEIRFAEQPNGVTIGCYMFMDSHTFDSDEAVECRGIAFDHTGKIVSRPLHKFFNVGEKTHLTLERLKNRGDLVGVFDKLDGSMIATAWVNHKLAWRSKKSFSSDVVYLAQAIVDANPNIHQFAQRVASNGLTAVFEITHPAARIVVNYTTGALRLLHVRDNKTGEYVMMDPSHEIHAWISEFGIEQVARYDITFDQAIESLESMTGQEGYIFQYKTGELVKVKCPWYLKMHGAVTFMRERDIARLALHEELDDVKQQLVSGGFDLAEVEAVETRMKNILVTINTEIERVIDDGAGLDRKTFAIKYRDHQYFGVIMSKFSGKDVDIKEWYERNYLREQFSLRVLGSCAEE